MKISFSFHQPHIRAKIIGIILIIVGVIFLIYQEPLYLKIGFASLLIGLFMIFMITEKSIPKKISDAQIEGNLEVVQNITKELNLTGNAIFIPKSNILAEERIFIPLNKKNVKLPEIDTDLVFATGLDGKSLGISVPPSGLKLLQEIEPEADFEHTTLDIIDEKLQTFVGMNMLKSIAFKKGENSWNLELENPGFCPNDATICQQYPCPTCSAALSAIARASQKNIWITDTIHNGKKTTFHIKLED